MNYAESSVISSRRDDGSYGCSWSSMNCTRCMATWPRKQYETICLSPTRIGSEKRVSVSDSTSLLSQNAGQVTNREPDQNCLKTGVHSIADCQRPQSRGLLKPETMTVTFEEFSSTRDLFDYTPQKTIKVTYLTNKTRPVTFDTVLLRPESRTLLSPSKGGGYAHKKNYV